MSKTKLSEVFLAMWKVSSHPVAVLTQQQDRSGGSSAGGCHWVQPSAQVFLALAEDSCAGG